MMAPDGKAVAHAELEIGDSKLTLADEIPEMKNPSPTTSGEVQAEFFVCEDWDKTFNQAVAEGAKILYSVEEQFWGDRHEVLKIQLDTDGQYQSVSDLSPEEMEKAEEEAMSKFVKRKQINIIIKKI